MSARVVFASGGEARVVSLDAKTIVLRSSVPSPPGSRLEGATGDAPVLAVRLKVHACKRQSDGSFEIMGRPLDMTRSLRERIEAGISGEIV